MTLYSYKNSRVLRPRFIWYVLDQNSSEIGYSSCSLIGNNYENGCMHAHT